MMTQRLAQRPLRASNCSALPRVCRSRRSVSTQALFGWGNKKDEAAEAAKEEEYRRQQEYLEKRRSGEWIKDVYQRRRKVSETLADRKAERRAEKESLANGVVPDTLKDWKPYKTKQDEEATSGIVVPLLPFGNIKYDEGERFDLRSPYAEEGWVDPKETDMMAGFKNIGKKLLNLSGKKEEEPEDKRVIWASDYARYKAEEDAKKNGQQ